MISIVIPTYNEEKNLPNLLKSIKKQTYKDYEIIIADNNSKDKTLQIARKFKCIIVKGGKPGVSRNNGAKVAKADLLFIDSDVFFKNNNVLEIFLYQIKKQKLDSACCKILPDSKDISSRCYYFIKNYFNKYFGYILPHVSGQFFFVSKNYFNKVNGYDENLFLAEEHDLVKRLKRFGAKFNFFMNIIVYNSARRVHKEGLLKLLIKNGYSEIYRLFFGKIRKKIIVYEFGKY